MNRTIKRIFKSSITKQLNQKSQNRLSTQKNVLCKKTHELKNCLIIIRYDFSSVGLKILDCLEEAELETPRLCSYKACRRRHSAARLARNRRTLVCSQLQPASCPVPRSCHIFRYFPNMKFKSKFTKNFFQPWIADTTLSSLYTVTS